MNNELIQNYKNLADQYQLAAGKKKKTLKLLALARLLSFLSIFTSFYFLYPISHFIAFITSIVFLTLFLFFIRKYIQTEQQLKFNQQLVRINLNEINALNRKYEAFDNGKEFINPHHDYSYDLDLFGEGSFFQFLNRTVTLRGKNRLASLLSTSYRTKEEILLRQQAVSELAKELSWRQNFMALGIETEEKNQQNHIDEIINEIVPIKSIKQLKLLNLILPQVTLLLIFISAANFTTKSFYLIPVFIQWFLFSIYSKTTSQQTKKSDKQSKLLQQYSKMLRLIESKSFQSEYLVNLQQKLFFQEKSASSITAELQKILNEFDYRQNFILAIFLNSVLLWDIRCLIKLNDWQNKYSANLISWFDVIAEIDALNSFGNCNYNHPSWTTPVISTEEFVLDAKNCGHPLIDEKKCINNDFNVSKTEQIAIITGANMAGKSTFLRTIGINLILAATGTNICAESFKFCPIRVFTSMRTSDNLMNDESYFYAELLRLQSMLSIIRNGEQLFVILDEMLKGTNSVDKLNGSKELINQLVTLNVHGIVATHDLGLTELVLKYRTIKNQCFEVQLHQDELLFDYKLISGITQTMNATYLMRKMGIIPN